MQSSPTAPRGVRQNPSLSDIKKAEVFLRGGPIFLGECDASIFGQTVHTLVASHGPYPVMEVFRQRHCPKQKMPV